MLIATDGRNPSLVQYVLRGSAFLIVLVILFVLLFMRYEACSAPPSRSTPNSPTSVTA